MERPEITRAIEAIVMVADLPIATKLLAELLEVPATEVDAACHELAAGYEVDGRGFILVKVAGGWRYQSHPELAEYVERFVLEGQSARLSAAALETLAIVAYKQPLSRAQVAAIRGVNVDGVMRTLEQRGYIDEVGRDPGPGQAVLFGTTTVFLEKLGLDSLEQLPPLSEFVPPAEIVEALEAGLRPDSEQLIRGERPADVTRGEVDAGAAGASDEAVSAEPGADTADDVPLASEGDEASSDEPPEPPVDHLARLDETTARLDALVDEVKGRIEATEAAVAEREAAESADDNAHDEAADGGEAADGTEAVGIDEGGTADGPDEIVSPADDGEPAHDAR